MKKFNVAILEDNKDLLKQVKIYVDESSYAEVHIATTKSAEFIKQVESKQIDLLIMDIELDGENINGIDVATILKKPVIFISGKVENYLTNMVQINLDFDFPVEFITKPATPDKVKKIIKKTIDQIQLIEKSNSSNWVHVSVGREKIQINQNEITHIESISDGNNNKIIYFINKKPITIHDFSFQKMVEKGFQTELFIRSHQSYRVNKNLIKRIELENKLIFVECFDKEGNLTEKKIQISDNYKPDIRKQFQKK